MSLNHHYLMLKKWHPANRANLTIKYKKEQEVSHSAVRSINYRIKTANGEKKRLGTNLKREGSGFYSTA